MSVLLIIMLLYGMFNSLRDSLLVMASIPFAMIGGILALWLTGINFSVAAAVGFISLLCGALLAGILLPPYYYPLRPPWFAPDAGVLDPPRNTPRRLLVVWMFGRPPRL